MDFEARNMFFYVLVTSVDTFDVAVTVTVAVAVAVACTI